MEWIPNLGTAVSLAVARDGVLFSLNEDNTAHKLVLSPKKRWFNLKDKFRELIAHPKANGVWALGDKDSRAYRYNRVWWEPKGKIPLRDISVTARGKVLAISEDNRLVQWNEKQEVWVQFEGPLNNELIRLSAETTNVFWAISDDGQLLKYTKGKIKEHDVSGLDDIIYDSTSGLIYLQTRAGAIETYNPKTKQRTLLVGINKARLKAIGSDGQVWALDAKNLIFSGLKKLPTDVVETNQIPVINGKKTSAEKRSSRSNQKETTLKSDPDTEPATKEKQPFKLNLAKIAGTAIDLSVGNDGRVFAALKNGSLQMWSNSKSAFFSFPGNANRLAVGPNNEIWAVSKSGRFLYFDGREWKSTSLENAKDVFVTSDGAVWVSDGKERVYSYNRKTKRFKRSKWKGIYFAFDTAGAFWGVRQNGNLVRCQKNNCRRLPGLAKDIVIGESGLIFMIDQANNLSRYLIDQGRWDLVRKNVLSLAIGPEDKPWLIETSGEIFASAFFARDETKDVLVAATAQKIINRKARLPGLAQSGGSSGASIFTFSKNMKFDSLSFEGSATPRTMYVGRNNSAYAISSDSATVWKFSSSKDKFKEYTDLPRTVGTTVRRIAVDLDGNAWFVYQDNQIWRPNGTDKYKQITSFTTASHIDINYEGKVIISDTGGTLYEYNESKDKFETFDDQDGNTSGDLSVDPDGHPWIYNTGGYLMEFTGKKFEFRPENKSQKLDNVGIGGDGSVYISEESGGSGRLLKWNFSNESFDSISLPSGVKALWVDVGPEGRPWFLSTDFKFYRAK